MALADGVGDKFAPVAFPVLEMVGDVGLFVVGGFVGRKALPMAWGRLHIAWIRQAGVPVCVFSPAPESMLGPGGPLQFPNYFGLDGKWGKRHGGSAVLWTQEDKLRKLRFVWEEPDAAASFLRLFASWGRGGERYPDVPEVLADGALGEIEAKPVLVVQIGFR